MKQKMSVHVFFQIFWEQLILFIIIVIQLKVTENYYLLRDLQPKSINLTPVTTGTSEMNTHVLKNKISVKLKNFKIKML